MRYFILILAVTFFYSCVSEIAIEDMESVPTAVKADEAFANIFQTWEGEWEGQLKIFEDLAPIQRNKKKLPPLDMSYLRTPTLKLQKIANIQRTYRSVNPYFQKMEVHETYYDNEGTELESFFYKGVQKVQKGGLWSVLQAKDTLVVRSGEQLGKKIAWQQDTKSAALMEYIEERVEDDILEVIGFAYYAGENQKQMPRFWYYGRYERKK